MCRGGLLSFLEFSCTTALGSKCFRRENVDRANCPALSPSFATCGCCGCFLMPYKRMKSALFNALLSVFTFLPW